MTSIVRIEKLGKYFREASGNKLEILSDIDARFEENQTVSIVGKSGSGKSTLLNLLGGLDHPSAGKVFFRNEEIFAYDANTLSDWRNRSIGFIFQAHHLLPDFSALENVMIPGMIAGRSKKECEKRAQELLKQTDLDDRASHKPNQLSGGEQQRIAIARALINSPDVILADEPTGNLDNKTGDKVALLLARICLEQSATLILVTHNTQLATSTDRQLRLSDGKLDTA